MNPSPENSHRVIEKVQDREGKVRDGHDIRTIELTYFSHVGRSRVACVREMVPQDGKTQSKFLVLNELKGVRVGSCLNGIH